MAEPAVDRTNETFGITVPMAFVNIAKPTGPHSYYEMTTRWKESPAETENTLIYDVRLVPLNGKLFFDARFVSIREKDKQLNRGDEFDMTASPGHVLGQIWIQPEFVRFSILNSEWINKNWPEELREVNSVGQYSDMIALLNSTASLREELSRNAGSEDLFRSGFYLCREGADCGRLAIEDQLARTPDDTDALEDAIEFYKVRGNFSKAIAAQRHEMEVKTAPNETEAFNNQISLAELLLCNREYESARNIAKQIKGPSSSGQYPQVELLVRSYFLEGEYNKTVETAKEIKENDQKSGHVIALAYFALSRLGRGKEAEDYLREETSSFKGPANEQLLLLYLSGRLRSDPHSKPLEISPYYDALLAIRDGKPETARSFLKEQIVPGNEKDDVDRVGAQIELERLGPPSPK